MCEARLTRVFPEALPEKGRFVCRCVKARLAHVLAEARPANL